MVNSVKPNTVSLPCADLLFQAVSQSFNAIVVTTAQLDGNGPTITYCNPAFCAMTGYTESELMGQSLRLLQGPMTHKPVLERLRACLEQGEYFQGSTFNYRKDGSPYLVEWNISPVRDPQGRINAFVSVQQDITARVKTEQRQALLAKALNAAHDAVLIISSEEKILFTNQAFEQLTGYSCKDLKALAPSWPAFYRHLLDMAKHGKSGRKTFANRHKNGTLYYLQQTLTPLLDEKGQTRHYVSVLKDVTEFVEREQILQEQAHRDALTGLLNRRGGTTQLQQYHRRAKQAGSAYAVLLGDIDNFKQINDSFGHDMGDIILKKLAKILAHDLDQLGVACRWGGEEFLMLLPDANVDLARKTAERIRENIAACPHPVVGTVTISVGVAVAHAHEHYDSVLQRADQALYMAKMKGRNLVVLADGSPKTVAN